MIGSRVSELFQDHGVDFVAAVPRAAGEPMAFGVGPGTWQALVDAVGQTEAGALADRCGDGPFLPDEDSGHLVKKIMDDEGDVRAFLFRR